jgi:streptogramin lyase
MKFTIDISTWIAQNQQAILPFKDKEQNKKYFNIATTSANNNKNNIDEVFDDNNNLDVS